MIDVIKHLGRVNKQKSHSIMHRNCVEIYQLMHVIDQLISNPYWRVLYWLSDVNEIERKSGGTYSDGCTFGIGNMPPKCRTLLFDVMCMCVCFHRLEHHCATYQTV